MDSVQQMYVRNQTPLSQTFRDSLNVTVYRNIFQMGGWQKPIFQGFISRVLFDIETRAKCFG